MASPTGCRGALYFLGGVSWIYLSEHDRMNALQPVGPPLLSI